MSERTVRMMVEAIQRMVRDTDLQAAQAADLSTKLSALQGNILAEIRACDAAFNLVLSDCLKTEKAANRARVTAETSDAYMRMREAHDTLKLAVAMERSLRSLVSLEQQAMRFSR